MNRYEKTHLELKRQLEILHGVLKGSAKTNDGDAAERQEAANRQDRMDEKPELSLDGQK